MSTGDDAGMRGLCFEMAGQTKPVGRLWWSRRCDWPVDRRQNLQTGDQLRGSAVEIAQSIKQVFKLIAVALLYLDCTLDLEDNFL